MDLADLRRLRYRFDRFVGEFEDCVKTRPSRRHLRTYVKGQLGPLLRKNVEAMALDAGVPVRTLQEFLSVHRWDHEAVARRVREIVRERHAHDGAIAVVDETSFAKKGSTTAGVKRQYCGATGKIDNCIVTVHLGYVAEDFHALIDGDLYLPDDWAADRERRRRAGIPSEVEYRAKWRIALDLLDRALGDGVRFRWLVADELYGRAGPFRDGVAARGLLYVIEIPKNLMGWTRSPRVEPAGTQPPLGRPTGHARIAPGETEACEVESLWERGGPSWQLFRIKDTDKGPVIWRVRESRFFPSEEGIPGGEVRLIVARNVLEDEVKYFLSNAPDEVPLKDLLAVAFSRSHIEQLFREGKVAVGFDEFQVRCYRSLRRHLVLTMLSLLFMAEQTQILRGEKPLVDALPGTGSGGGPTGPVHEPQRAAATAPEGPEPDLVPTAARG